MGTAPELLTIDNDRTMFEVAELAASAGVVVVERAGRMALVGRDNVPEGWHRVSAGVRAQP